MKRIFQKRLQLQLLFALLAAVSVAALATVLVLDAIRHAEGMVLADTNRTLRQTIEELQRESRIRISGDSSWSSLPETARDLSLRAISQTVLAAYPGVEGGFAIGTQLLGYSYPTHDGGSVKVDVPLAERSEIEGVIAAAGKQGTAEQVIRGKHDLVVISAVDSGDMAAWAMKRLPGQAEAGARDRSVVLAALVGVAMLGAAGVLATGIGLNRGVAQITRGLASLDQELPQRNDELGEISAAVNEMAQVRRRLEAEVRREDRLRTTGRLVARIAHDLRNPLNGIRLWMQMLEHRQATNTLKPGDFQAVIDEVDRMSRLLSELLAFQQPRPPQTEPHRVGPVLQECAQWIGRQAAQRGVEIALAGGDGISAIFDEQYLRQIVTNLLLNALEVSGRGGKIEVQARGNERTTEIEIIDHGPGLNPEQLEHLFEPFFTTKADGHGLGLAVSRELAQSMGGDLSFRPGEGGGAIFILTLRGAANGVERDHSDCRG